MENINPGSPAASGPINGPKPNPAAAPGGRAMPTSLAGLGAPAAPAPGGTAEPQLAGVDQERLAEMRRALLEKLFDLGGDVMVAATGREHWSLNERERELLALSGGYTCAAYGVSLDPKKDALGLFVLALIAIGGGRVAKDRAILRLEAEKNRGNEASPA